MPTSTGGTAVHHAPAASDAELVRAVRAHDDEAFEELYRRYRPAIAAFVRRLVRDEGRAEDVTQEAFVAALRSMRHTDCEIHFRPWIYAIARNAAIDYRRRSGRAVEVPFDAAGELAASDSLRLVGPSAPEASVIDKERLDNLCGALDELSETHHRIIVMRELEGLSYREIGRRLQLSSAAVESTLFRARRRLETEYRQLDTGRRCVAIRKVIARMAEGAASRGDLRRLDRHARRCRSCRHTARQLGVQPASPRSTPRRALALLPFPGLLRRWGACTSRPADAGVREVASNPGVVETLSGGAQKAAAVLASAIAVGGGGATLGGVGPLAGDRPAVVDRPGAVGPTQARHGTAGRATGRPTREGDAAAGIAGGAEAAPGSGGDRTRDAGPGEARRPERAGLPISGPLPPGAPAPNRLGAPVPSLRAPDLPALPGRAPASPTLDLPAGAISPSMLDLSGATDLTGGLDEAVPDVDATTPYFGGTAQDVGRTAADLLPEL